MPNTLEPSIADQQLQDRAAQEEARRLESVRFYQGVEMGVRIGLCLLAIGAIIFVLMYRGKFS